MGTLEQRHTPFLFFTKQKGHANHVRGPKRQSTPGGESDPPRNGAVPVPLQALQAAKRRSPVGPFAANSATPVTRGTYRDPQTRPSGVYTEHFPYFKPTNVRETRVESYQSGQINADRNEIQHTRAREKMKGKKITIIALNSRQPGASGSAAFLAARNSVRIKKMIMIKLSANHKI
jgi:hypothetical protein